MKNGNQNTKLHGSMKYRSQNPNYHGPDESAPDEYGEGDTFGDAD